MTPEDPNSRRERNRAHTLVVPILLTAVVTYGAFLRCDALFERFGPFARPGWVVSLQHGVHMIRAPLVPRHWKWDKASIGGDPVAYLRFAREMRSFYQAHVREPVFLAATRRWLIATANEDVGVSLSSVSFSILTLIATYLLGAAVVSPWVGLVAASVLAIDRDMVSWSTEGWRDDAFTAMVGFSAWAIVRLWQRRTWRSALLAGIFAGLACLTRITALSFLLPAFALTALPAGRRTWQVNLASTMVAAAVMTAIVAPYLINCYRVFGDPFYAIDYHTHFYRARSGVPSHDDESALTYVKVLFASRPIAAIDTAARGLFAYPLTIKWHGLDMWMSGLVAAPLEWLAVAGLFVWLWQPLGRLLLAMLLGSLVPYMMTWAVLGGGEWRFTMHAYLFYLVAAFSLVGLASHSARHLSTAGAQAFGALRANWRRVSVRAAVLVATMSAALAWSFWSPSLVAGEAVRAGEEVNIPAGPDDAVFFREGWSRLVATGAVTARFAIAHQAVLYVPLPEPRPYQLVIRMDPVPSNPAQRVHVFLDRQPIGSITLAWDPARVGSYQVAVPSNLAGRRLAPLTLVADSIAPAGNAASLYPGILPGQAVAFRLWYVRVRPM